MRGKQAAYAAIISAILCWGLSPVATRELVAHIDPMHLLLLRFSIAGIVFSPTFIQLRSWSSRDRMKIAASGLVVVLGYYLPVTVGGKYIPSGMTGLLIATETLWMSGLSVIFFHERLTVKTLAGMAVSGLGIYLLLGGPAEQAHSGNLLIGGALTLCAAIMWCVYSLMVRPLVAKYGAFPSTALPILFGIVPLLFSINANLKSEISSLTPESIGALILLAVFSTIIGNFLWSFGLARVSGIQAGLFLPMIPLVSVQGGVLILHETLSFQIIISGIMIIGGVILSQLTTTSHVPIPEPPFDAGASHSEQEQI